MSNIDSWYTIYNELKFKGYTSDEVSPNLVADVAHRLGIQLTANEVVIISNNY